jgi:hypothetical protein
VTSKQTVARSERHGFLERRKHNRRGGLMLVVLQGERLKKKAGRWQRGRVVYL